MLPSLGFQEIVLLAVIALVVVGPKDLPLLLRKLGRWTAKLRAMAQEFRTGFDELARQAELDELKREVEALRRDQTMQDVEREITRPALAYESGPPAASPASPGDPEEGAAVEDPFTELSPEDIRQPTEARSGGEADEPVPTAAGGAR